MLPRLNGQYAFALWDRGKDVSSWRGMGWESIRSTGRRRRRDSSSPAS